jgi:hypothetical protein
LTRATHALCAAAAAIIAADRGLPLALIILIVIIIEIKIIFSITAMNITVIIITLKIVDTIIKIIISLSCAWQSLSIRKRRRAAISRISRSLN